MRPRSLLGLLGAALALAGAVAVFLPGALLSVGPVRRAVEAVGGVEPTAAVLLASGVTGLYLAVAARSGGSGRAASPEDPADRIDWRHYAKRDELTTVSYRERRASSVVVVVDARPASRVVAGPARPTAVELAAYAATHALEDLLGAGHEVGVAVLGAAGPDAAGLHWLAPGSGRDRQTRAGALLAAATEATADGSEVDPDSQASRIARLAPPRAQLALFSPLLDDWPVEAVEAWGVRDYSRVVLSPDVLTHNTVTGQFETVRRHTRLATCQAAGARVVDWSRATPLYAVLEAAFAVDARGALAGGSS